VALSQTETIDWSNLTELHAAILEAYFALYQERDPTTIGSAEILHWFRKRGRTEPSESLVRTVLSAIELPRRGGGRPAHVPREPDQSSPPLPSVRAEAPQPRRSRPR